MCIRDSRTSLLRAHIDKTWPLAEVMTSGGRFEPRADKAALSMNSAEATRSMTAMGSLPMETTGICCIFVAGERGWIVMGLEERARRNQWSIGPVGNCPARIGDTNGARPC